MEENNYRDDFEHFLKGNADEFKMVPSRKVWFSLYNNLHPDRRWPSMAVCLLILTAVLYLGIANNNSLSSAARKASTENFSAILNDIHIDNKITFSAKDYIKIIDLKQPEFSIISTKVENALSEYNTAVMHTDKEVVTPIINEYARSENENEKDILTEQLATFKSNSNNNSLVKENLEITQKNTISFAEIKIEIPQQKDNSDSSLNLEPAGEYVTPSSNNNALNATLEQVEKSWKEDYAFKNKPAINQFKQNASLSYYVTPSFGYRIFSKKSEMNYANPTLANGRIINDANPLLDDAALNLEGGAILQYSLSKKFRLKTGVQANYTTYISNVTATGHPSQTSLTYSNSSNLLRSSNYTTKAGGDRINKSTMQVSMPIGADYKIAGRGRVNWYVGGTIQPTYILSGSAFVLSTDEKYYISETALLRKINLNTAVETFISLKSSHGIILNVGPQFRYQLLSSYKNAYNYTEKIYNVGLKIGVSTSF